MICFCQVPAKPCSAAFCMLFLLLFSLSCFLFFYFLEFDLKSVGYRDRGPATRRGAGRVPYRPPLALLTLLTLLTLARATDGAG